MSKIKEFLIPEGYSEKLVVDYNDIDYVKINQKFLKILDEEYEMFINRLKDEERKNAKYIKLAKEEKMLFFPEILTRRSPITLINAPWGSGKTYFIESLIRNFLDKKVKTEKFEKIIILDVWKYSNSENPQKDIMENLFEILSNTSEKMKKFFYKWNKKLINTILIPQINSFGFGFEKIKDENEKNEDNFENQSIDFPKTIIFFDNLERLGNQSWDVIKSIVRFAQFENFIIVLPMNIEKLMNNEANNNDEYPIEKFIDIKYFEFKSNYSLLLIEANFKQEVRNLLNESLNENYDGRSISVREAKQRFESLNISNIKNKYDKLQFFFKNIWPPSDNLKKYISNQINIYIFNLENLENLFNEFMGKWDIYFDQINDEFQNINSRLSSVNNKLFSVEINQNIKKIQSKWVKIDSEFDNHTKGSWISNCSEWTKNLYSFFLQVEKYVNFLKKNENEENLHTIISIFLDFLKNLKKLSDEYNKEEKKMLEKTDKDLLVFSSRIFKESKIVSTKDFGEKIHKSILNIDYKNESSDYLSHSFYNVPIKQI